MKSLLLSLVFGFMLSACVASNNAIYQVNALSKNLPCSVCNSKDGFEAKIKGLFYVSDYGIVCCANKRTLDTSVALKKVYLHRFYDLAEENKIVNDKKNNKKFLVDMSFNAAFYVYLKQELKARGIVVMDDNSENSPYVIKVDLAMQDYRSNIDSSGLHSRLVATLNLTDINMNKKLTVRTRQDVSNFTNIKDLIFYNHLLVKQMANKTASIISELP